MKFDRIRAARIQRAPVRDDPAWDQADRLSAPAPAAGGRAGGAAHHLDRIAISAEDRPAPTATPSPLQTRTERQDLPFAVAIRRAEATDTRSGCAPRLGGASIALPGSAEHDDSGGGGNRSDERVLALAKVPPPTSELAELKEGQTAHLPDMTMAELAKIAETDTIGSSLTYQPTITQASSEPSGSGTFGETYGYDIRLTGISVTATPGAFRATATVVNPITFNVRSATGPEGQLNITSDGERVINSANYLAVAADLTPNNGDLNGRPKRDNFWSKDLTITHEQFHATEGREHARGGVTLAQNRLSAQQAASVNEVQTLIAQVPGIVADTRRAAMAYPGREERAYRDGAPLYRARAGAIKTKGDNGGYPDPPGARQEKERESRRGR